MELPSHHGSTFSLPTNTKAINLCFIYTSTELLSSLYLEENSVIINNKHMGTQS